MPWCRVVSDCLYWLDLNQSVSQCVHVSLFSLLPDCINLLFYLPDLLSVLPSLVVWDHGGKFVNLLLVLPVIKRREGQSAHVSTLYCIVVKIDGQPWNLLAENYLFFFWCLVLVSCHDECWICVRCCKCVWSRLTFISLSNYGRRSCAFR